MDSDVAFQSEMVRNFFSEMMDDADDSSLEMTLQNVKGEAGGGLMVGFRSGPRGSQRGTRSRESRTGSTLTKVIEYCKYHVEANRDKKTEDEMKNWDSEFVKVEQSLLFELILAANYLNIKDLLDLTCQKVADMIRVGASWFGSRAELAALFGLLGLAPSGGIRGCPLERDCRRPWGLADRCASRPLCRAG